MSAIGYIWDESAKKNMWLFIFVVVLMLMASVAFVNPTSALAHQGEHNGAGHGYGQGVGYGQVFGHGCAGGGCYRDCGYVDSDNDGVCDRYEYGGHNLGDRCSGYVDVDGDSVCDHCRTLPGQWPGYSGLNGQDMTESLQTFPEKSDKRPEGLSAHGQNVYAATNWKHRCAPWRVLV